MAFDFKKEYKELYQPKTTPTILTIPPAQFIAIKGAGDPNPEDSDYKKGVGLLYALAYTIKMSKKGMHQMEGYFDFVVPPLEGFWKQTGKTKDFDYAHKENFEWLSAIRVPDFVTREEFEWAKREATQKKKMDFSSVELLTIDEGPVVQCLHVGAYDDEPETIRKMDEVMESQGYVLDINDHRLHHEIYLSDPRKSVPDKLKTIIRHPVRKNQEE